ncbi:hypothetical protein PUN28_002539 [Cardiocondyla obscurior]|uniref:Uncharacterized protein n=1 Tax=Cardiocondyla obscurior TaxID=286306 RepID=A0AAW2GUT5_9HYME
MWCVRSVVCAENGTGFYRDHRLTRSCGGFGFMFNAESIAIARCAHIYTRKSSPAVLKYINRFHMCPGTICSQILIWVKINFTKNVKSDLYNSQKLLLYYF